MAMKRRFHSNHQKQRKILARSRTAFNILTLSLSNNKKTILLDVLTGNIFYRIPVTTQSYIKQQLRLNDALESKNI